MRAQKIQGSGEPPGNDNENPQNNNEDTQHASEAIANPLVAHCAGGTPEVVRSRSGSGGGLECGGVVMASLPLGVAHLHRRTSVPPATAASTPLGSCRHGDGPGEVVVGSVEPDVLLGGGGGDPEAVPCGVAKRGVVLVGVLDGLPQALWSAFGDVVVAGFVGLVGDLVPGAVRGHEPSPGACRGRVELCCGGQVELGVEPEGMVTVVQEIGGQGGGAFGGGAWVAVVAAAGVDAELMLHRHETAVPGAKPALHYGSIPSVQGDEVARVDRTFQIGEQDPSGVALINPGGGMCWMEQVAMIRS